MFYIYILQSLKNKELYIGFTSDLKRRLSEHNQGLNFSTKRYLPWKLIYYEACIEESDAKRREKYLKTTQGGRLIKRRMKDYMYKSRSESLEKDLLQDKSRKNLTSQNFTTG